MNRKYNPLLIAMSVILVASACLVTLPAPVSIPVTSTPVASQTQKGKLLIATPSLTAPRANPSLTPANTMTSFPSITPLPTATATATETPYGYVPSPTPAPPPTAVETPTGQVADPDEGYTTEWGSTHRCSLIEKSPFDWMVVPAQSKYKASWTLLNSGTKTWQANEMTLTFVDGTRLTIDKKESLLRDVRVGQTITPVINIYPPKEPGNYKSVWGLRIIKTGRLFCTFTIKITVK